MTLSGVTDIKSSVCARVCVCVCVCAHISVLMGVSIVFLMEVICRGLSAFRGYKRTFQCSEKLTDYVCSLPAT